MSEVICKHCGKPVYIVPKQDKTSCGKTEEEQWFFHKLHFCEPDWQERAEVAEARIKELEEIMEKDGCICGVYMKGGE